MANYRPPGVNVTIVDNPANALVPGGIRIPCIVATGLNTSIVPNVAVTRGSGTTDTIPDTTALSDVSSILTVGDFPDLGQYKENVDWRQTGNIIVWINGGQAPSTGATYYTSYRAPKAAAVFNKGVIYTSLQDVRNDFGNELINGIVTPITTAAKLCFDNGAAAVMIIQAQTASQTDLESALDAAKIEDVDLIVAPQMCNTTLDNYVKAHVLTESSPQLRHERVWFRSADGLSDSVTTIRAYAQGMAHERVTVMAPPAFVTTLQDSVTTNDQDVLLPSGYLAAAYAGIVADPGNDAATPLTRKSFVGVKNLSSFNYTETNKNMLGAAGVTVVDNYRGTFRIRHALTTDTTNVNRVTQSVVFIKDNIKKELRQLLDSSFIGSKIDESLPSRIAASIDAFLKQKVSDTIVKSYRNIAVVQDTVDPRTLKITFDVSPIYPLEYVDITVALIVG
jgi:hypothetical protein